MVRELTEEPPGGWLTRPLPELPALPCHGVERTAAAIRIAAS